MLYDKKWDEQLPVTTFKTAKELGLRDSDYATLLRLLVMFEEGEIPEKYFDMARIGEPECGTPGCIIGWGRTINKKFINTDWTIYCTSSSAYYNISDLFSPGYADATTKDAERALRSLLTTGKCNWHITSE